MPSLERPDPGLDCVERSPQLRSQDVMRWGIVGKQAGIFALCPAVAVVRRCGAGGRLFGFGVSVGTLEPGETFGVGGTLPAIPVVPPVNVHEGEPATVEMIGCPAGFHSPHGDELPAVGARRPEPQTRSPAVFRTQERSIWCTRAASRVR